MSDTKESLVISFSECTICHKPNEKGILKQFYESKKHSNQLIKEKIIELSYNIDSLDIDHLSVGIPCCRCYRKLYRKTPRNSNHSYLFLVIYIILKTVSMLFLYFLLFNI